LRVTAVAAARTLGSPVKVATVLRLEPGGIGLHWAAQCAVDLTDLTMRG